MDSKLILDFYETSCGIIPDCKKCGKKIAQIPTGTKYIDCSDEYIKVELEQAWNEDWNGECINCNYDYKIEIPSFRKIEVKPDIHYLNTGLDQGIKLGGISISVKEKDATNTLFLSVDEVSNLIEQLRDSPLMQQYSKREDNT